MSEENTENAERSDYINELTSLITDHPEKIAEGIDKAIRFAGIDGGHHKVWLIDQLMRGITGENYEKFLDLYNVPEYDEWDTGIAP